MEIVDLSSDVCQLVEVLFAIRRPGMSRSDSNTNIIGTKSIKDILRDSLDCSPLEDDHKDLIGNIIMGRIAADFGHGSMQHQLNELQKAVAKLNDVVNAARPGGILVIVLRVGLSTLAAAGVGAPVTAVVFDDPVGRKVLEAALATFIGAAIVESGAVGIDAMRRVLYAGKSSPPSLVGPDGPVADKPRPGEGGPPGQSGLRSPRT